ncbi:MAG: IMP dehydrogenase [Vicinamibacterales bacterium]
MKYHDRLFLDLVRGCTFDDFIFKPRFSTIERRDPTKIDLGSRLSEHLSLKRPVVSANMDTVTRAPMAIVQAEEGGIGIIDRGFRPGDIGPQVREVEIVKRTQHGIIDDPYAIGPSASVSEAAEAMSRSRVGTLVVIDGERKLLGLLTERDVRFADPSLPVSERMTPVERLVTSEGRPALDEAARVMAERKVKKLPLVSRDGRLAGLITAKDIGRQQALPFASRDRHGRLMVGAAIGATGDYMERAAALIAAGADIIVMDIAHGHSVVMERALEAFRRRFPDVEMAAGNVATGEGAGFLAERGANAVKVGIGPGGGCTTRIATNFGVPQVQALAECRHGLVGRFPHVPIIADGGVRRDGALVAALLFGGDTVMLGSAFAGTEETPGEVVQRSVVLPESHKVVQVPFKVLRGMASIEAIKDRLDVEEADLKDLQALGAEGLEVSVPERGSVRPIIGEMIKHLCSAVSYGGARSLSDLRRAFQEDPGSYATKLTSAARRESFER